MAARLAVSASSSSRSETARELSSRVATSLVSVASSVHRLLIVHPANTRPTADHPASRATCHAKKAMMTPKTTTPAATATMSRVRASANRTSEVELVDGRSTVVAVT